jgi:putative Mn2+ efflux pump MntP
MEPLTLFIVAVGLAMDVFSVSLGIGTGNQVRTARSIFRLAFHMGFFQGLFTFLGWLAGSSIARFISGVDHWVALGLLAYVGIKMIRAGLTTDADSYKEDPSRGKTLVVLSIACSIDAMAVGLSMALLQVSILVACLVIGLVSLVFSLVGSLAGKQLGILFGKRMEILGGLILLGIGLRILVTHLRN